jgi:hypothetical protein
MKRLLFSLLCVCAFQITASAHILDEYLQAAQITVASDGLRVELNLTPGVDVADRVFAVIDSDRNRQISRGEEQAYVQRVLREITLKLDERPLSLLLTGVEFPSRIEMKEGLGVIRLKLFAASTMSPGEHKLSFRNEHLPEIAVYQANTLQPKAGSIEITSQQRDALQHEIDVNFRIFSIASSDPPRVRLWSVVLLLKIFFVATFGLAYYFFRRRHSSARAHQ